MHALNLVLLFSLFACDDTCVLNSQCAPSESCSAGRCKQRCEGWVDCAEGEACIDGVCDLPPPGYCERQPLVYRGDTGVVDELALSCPPPDGGFPPPPVIDMRPRPDRAIQRDMRPFDLDRAAPDQLTADQGDGGAGDRGLDHGLDQGATTDQGEDLSPPDQRVDQGRPISITPWLTTAGHEIRNPDGSRFRGRGANLHDTRSCGACAWSPANVNEVLRRADELIDVWGATLIRLNLESDATDSGRVQWRGLTMDEAYRDDIARIVHHIGRRTGVYVMVSLWEDPTLSPEGWPQDETDETYRLLVRLFHDTPQVIFGVSHEPLRNENGAQDAECWVRMNHAVQVIREEELRLNGRRHLIAVQGTRDRGRDLSYYLERPIEVAGGAEVIYEAHIFNPSVDFERLLTTPANTLPVILGAFGPYDDGIRSMSAEDGQSLIQLAERIRVPWVAWTFHGRCRSEGLLVDQSGGGCGVGMPLQPNDWGQIVREQLQTPQE
ncbi:MAG: cellulase family glycosylhydrolase [Myxococcota bacterium]|nr:cellulase family glycosylhydrolase [Myxococcota bacterium]